MADENKIFIELVLDDGALTKGFAKVSSEGKKTAQELNSAFSAKDIFGSNQILNMNALLSKAKESVTDLVGNYGKLGIAVAGAVAAGLAAKKAFDLTLEGEKIIQINNSFEVLAARAGFAGETLKHSLEEAAGGLADTTKLMQIASIALGEMGANAAKLPEVLGVARVAAVKFGGDVADRFQEINQAILSTNTKSLKQIGLFIDAGQVVEDYAKANGRAADEVTQLGKQQAILEAILKESKNAYAGVDESQAQATVASKRLSVSLGEMHDSLALLAESSFGKIFADIANGLVYVAQGITGIAPGVRTQIRQIDDDLSAFNEKLIAQQERAKENAEVVAQEQAGTRGFFGQLMYGTVDPEYLNAKISDTLSQIDSLQKKKEALLRAQGPGEKGALFDESKRQAESIKNTEAYYAALQKAQMDNLNIQLAGASAEKDLKLQEDLKYQMAKMAFLAEDEKIEKDFAAKRGINKQMFDELQLLNETNYRLKLQEIQKEFNLKKTEEEQKTADRVKAINQLAQNALLSVISATVQRIGANLKEGGMAWADFKNVVLNIIGDMAIQIGTMLIGVGIGIEQLKVALATLSGGAAIAAGLALVAIGGLLKSMGSSGLSNSPSSGTGFTDEGNLVGTNPDLADEKVERDTNTSVVVNIQGDILDSDETGIRVVNILNDAFDKKGVVIRSGAVG